MSELLRSPARILVVGGGGREHALAWRLAGERAVEQVIVAPGSDGIATEPGVECVAGVMATDAAAIIDLARSRDVELVVIGPEAPLAAGVGDALVEAGIPTFGPGAGAARIESSKAFCREVAGAARVRIARGAAFSERHPAHAFAGELAGAPGSTGVVVKADGLAAGKGVSVCDSIAEADAAIDALFDAAPTGTADAARVVVEERLHGREASLIALCDGRTALALPPARDHKRLADGDRGPNTGGMGAYSPLPDLTLEAAAQLVASIHLPILAELAGRGISFRGALYAGLMLTATGPVLLECNARFGDPETQVLLPRLAIPLGPLLLGAARGELAVTASELGVGGPMLPSTDGAAVAIVLAAAGYPATPLRGVPIGGLAEARATGALVFHAGTGRGQDGTFLTAGGRVLSVVALGADLGTARDRAERAAAMIHFDGAQRRHDIAAGLPEPVLATGMPA